MTAQSTVKKSQASIVVAWVRKNCRQVVRLRGGRDPQPPQDPPHRGCPDPDAEAEQLAWIRL